MLIRNDDDTFTSGPLDAIFVLRDTKTRRLHVCFAEWHQPPGPPQDFDRMPYVRLKSKMHHTAGAADLDECKVMLADLRKKISLPDSNVFAEPRDWDGEPFVATVVNWRLSPMLKVAYQQADPTNL